MKAVSFLRDVTLKSSGRVIPMGTGAIVEFMTEKVQGIDRDFMKVTLADGETFRTSHYSLFFKPPHIHTLEKWSNDGVCKTVTGKRTEMDGHGDDNSPSWLLALGMI
jgi:hypothetical protein